MNQYKPEFFGKLFPVDHPEKANVFMTYAYETVSTIYDTCKAELENVSDVSLTELSTKEHLVSVRLKAEEEVYKRLSERCKKSGLTMHGDVITAKF